MLILSICLFITLLLPVVAKAPVAYAMKRLGHYDNNHPRAQQSQLTGLGARALAAHQNAFEALIMFAPAILLAITMQQTGTTIQLLAVIFVTARVFYNILYLLGWSTLRSTIWAIGFISNMTIVWYCIP